MTKEKDIDPRSVMTDRGKFMTRSLHTVRIVTIVATDLAKRERITQPTEAVRRALRYLELPHDYDAETDPTMKQCVLRVKEALSK